MGRQCSKCDGTGVLGRRPSPVHQARIAEAQALRRQGLTQQAIAERLGVHRVTVSGWMQRPTEGTPSLHVARSSNGTALPSVHFSSETDEWTTPAHILDRVVAVMGAIDLDPCADADRTVPAASHFTRLDDGLVHPWRGRVFMNPPYGRVIIDWVRRLHAEFTEGRTTEAIALVPARTDAAWFRYMSYHLRCFVRGRLRFGGQDNSAPFPSVVVYLGANEARFREVFADVGSFTR